MKFVFPLHALAGSATERTPPGGGRGCLMRVSRKTCTSLRDSGEQSSARDMTSSNTLLKIEKQGLFLDGIVCEREITKKEREVRRT